MWLKCVLAIILLSAVTSNAQALKKLTDHLYFNVCFKCSKFFNLFMQFEEHDVISSNDFLVQMLDKTFTPDVEHCVDLNGTQINDGASPIGEYEVLFKIGTNCSGIYKRESIKLTQCLHDIIYVDNCYYNITIPDLAKFSEVVKHTFKHTDSPY